MIKVEGPEFKFRLWDQDCELESSEALPVMETRANVRTEEPLHKKSKANY